MYRSPEARRTYDADQKLLRESDPELMRVYREKESSRGKMRRERAASDPALAETLRIQRKESKLRAKLRREEDPALMEAYRQKCNTQQKQARLRRPAEHKEYHAQQWVKRKAQPLKAKEIHAMVKVNANRRGIPFTLTVDDIEWLLTLSPICAISGIPLSLFRCNPHRVSVDRIDSSKGYTQENIQLVSATVNYMKQEFPEYIFFAVCREVANHQATP
jgi:hypothetical protein